MAQKKKVKKPNLAKLITEFRSEVLSRFDTVGGRLDNHDKKFDSMGKRFDAIDGRLDNHDKKFDSIEKQLGTLENKVDAHTADIITSQEKIAGTLDAVHALLQQGPLVKNLEQRVETLERDSTVFKAAIKKINEI